MQKMEKKRFRIGELAKKLNLETSVIRFWEKEFGISSKRSDGSQRFYTEDDYKKFEKIKELLHIKKFTIAGAKSVLNDKSSNEFISAAIRSSELKKNDVVKIIPSTLEKDILELQKKLIQLRELL